MPAAHADIVVAGHVCLDVIPTLRGPLSAEPGSLTEVGPATLSTGGVVANTGLALHRLGVPVRLVGKVGDDVFGRAVLELLGEHAPSMVVAAGEATSYSIVLEPPGVDRSFLHCPGANDTFTAADVRPEHLAGARIFHFGYPPIMRRMYENGGVELARVLVTARKAGLLTSLDVSKPDPGSDAGRVDWEALLEHVLPFADVFSPSLDELLFMLRRTPAPPSLPLLHELADRLLGMGAQTVAIKLGECGLYVRTAREHDRAVLAPCFQARRVAGTTGSGDCTVAGFLAATLHGEDTVRAATIATAVGACSVEEPGATAGVPPWPEVEARLANGWARHPLAVQAGEADVLDRDAFGTLTVRA